jgi:hypothetical protein
MARAPRRVPLVTTPRPAVLPGPVVALALPSGPTPIRPSRTLPAQKAAWRRAGLVAALATAPTRLVHPTAALRVAARPRPRRAGTLATEQTWPASPVLANPLPRVWPVVAGRPARRSGRSSVPCRTPWTASGLPPDLPAAMVAWLGQNATVTAAFGGAPFFAETVTPGTAFPYAYYEEPREQLTFQSPDASGQVQYFGRGEITWNVVTSGKLTSRQLGELIGGSLNDAPLTFLDGTLLELRWSNPWSQSIRALGAAGNIPAFRRVLVFTYMVQRTL